MLAQTPDFEIDTLLLDTFDDWRIDSTHGVIGDGWDVNGNPLGAIPAEEAGGALQFFPVSESAFNWIDMFYAPLSEDHVFPLGESGNSSTFDWVISDLEVTGLRTAGGTDYVLQLGVDSSEVGRTMEQQSLWRHNDGGVMIQITADSDGAGNTAISASMLVADETNIAESHNGVVGAVSTVALDADFFGETENVWSNRRLSIRLTLTEQSGE